MTQQNETQKSVILGLLAETSIHAGTGQTTGVIDLPIQREAHTGWPCVYGSAVKGALRTRAEDLGYRNDWVADLFGPETNAGTGLEHAGALMVGDARLLLLPVRSLTSHFKWVTCPAVLGRFKRDCERLGVACALPEVSLTDDDKALVPEKKQDYLYLEEFRFAETEDSATLPEVIKAIAPFMARTDATDALNKQLAVVSDAMFKHLASYATPVNAHIAIEKETKTVKGGALWYEETLPPDTLLYMGITASASRRLIEKVRVNMPANTVLSNFSLLFPTIKPYLQLGGNETVGMGWCKVTMVA
jgi:CRISPR-associated protein Cmr4